MSPCPRLLFALSLSTLLAACGPSIPSSIKIGVAQPLSGPSADRGKDLFNGAKLAAGELNAAGFKIAGKPVTIEIVALDDKADKETAKKVAQEMVDQKVSAVIGHLNSDVTEVAVPIYKAGNVPQLFTSSAAELTKLGEGNAFRLVANDALQAQALASYAGGTLRAKKVAMIYENTAFGAPMQKDCAAALVKDGRSVQIATAVDNKTTDFAAFVAQLKAAPPDVLIAVLRDYQLIPLFQQMQAAQLSEIPVLATSVAKTAKLAAASGMKSLYVTSGALGPQEFYAGSDFLNKFRAAYNADPVWAAHYAYDAVYAVTNAMRLAESTDPKALRDKLHGTSALAPVTSQMRFTAEGEQAYGAIAVYERRGGNWEPLMRSDKW